MQHDLSVRAARVRATLVAAGGALALLAAVAGCTRGRPARAAADAPTMDVETAGREIEGMMRRSAAAWNRGELDAFMEDYRAGTRTTYIGSAGIVRGPAAIHDVYAPRFGPGGVRDSLSFENTEVDLLAPGVANVISWYVLSRGDSVVARGPTSLVMLHENGRWRIVHDHSS